MRSFSAVSIPALPLALLALPGAAAAQITIYAPPTDYERGCRGDATSMQMDRRTMQMSAYPAVTLVLPGSPAELAGMQVGDSIISRSGVDLLTGTPPTQRFAVGDTVRMVVRRAGREHDIVVVLGRREGPPPGDDPASPGICRPAPLPAQAAAQDPSSPPPAAYERGCRGDEIRGEVDLRTGLARAYPVITRVNPGSPAEVAGLQVGDSITSQGGVDLLTGTPPRQRFAVGDTIHMVVRRAGREYHTALVMGRRDAPPGDASGAAACRPVAVSTRRD